jgi:hypothetical protein
VGLAGNKPLAFSGRLEEDAPRRLAETSRFVEAVTAPGGLRPRGDGLACAVRVRLVHAAVRRMLARSSIWRAEAWGAPINQADMAGTVMLFSLLVLDGLERLGVRTTRAEREDYLHLWRYTAYLLGVDEELRCASEAEARALWDLLSSTQDDPDDDSRALARALMESPVRGARRPADLARARRMRPVGYALSRYLLGDAYADRLGYPRTPLARALPVVRLVNLGARDVLRVVPGAPERLADYGRRYWREVVARSLGSAPATFEMPDRLRRAANEAPRGGATSRSAR